MNVASGSPLAGQERSNPCAATNAAKSDAWSSSLAFPTSVSLRPAAVGYVHQMSIPDIFWSSVVSRIRNYQFLMVNTCE